ncbi:alpha/beta hydrolase [Plantactinospora sp. CA-290183]|uniref:alpha/beta hydrolase n=1 Tax=Plantactinospora sp. CA-290183 TaxID=3240006 RepID=UPI003D8D3110
MRRTIRTTVGAATALLVLLGAAPAVAAAPPDAAGETVGGWRPGPIDWQPCPELPDDPAVRCATLTLPIDWARPSGPTFSLAIAKRSATDPDARIGPLLVNPGGPGGSGVDDALDAERGLSPEILRRFDVIGFDPRGVARSNPIVCSLDLLAQQPHPAVATADEYGALLSFNRRVHDDCRANTGPLFDHLDSVDVARDMDAVRAALGERKISTYGVSYGTLVGQMYAEQFPHRVRAMVLDSTMDHSLGARDFLRTETVGAQESFEQFAAWCDRTETCALHGQDVSEVFDRLTRRADAGELTEPDTDVALSWFDLSNMVVSAGYRPSWTMLAEWLAALDRTSGDPSAAGRTSSERAPAPRPVPAGTLGWPAADPADRAAEPELVQYPFPIFCDDWSMSIRDFDQYSRHLAENRRLAPQVRASALGLFAVTACLGWPGEVGNPQHRLAVRTEFPLLVLNSRYDPSTPYQWAVNVADQLGRHGRLVTYQGWGHGAYDRTPCTIATVDRYLVDRKLPPVGATCAAAANPESAPPSRRSAERVPTLPTWSLN